MTHIVRSQIQIRRVYDMLDKSLRIDFGIFGYGLKLSDRLSY